MISYQNYGLKDLIIKVGESTILNNEYDLKSFILNFEANKHSILEMELEIFNEEINKFIQINRTVDLRVAIAMNTIFENEKEEIMLFDGHILNSSLYNSGKNRYFLKIKAFSVTEKMDRVKKYRAFQNIGLTYEEVVKQIFEDYKEIPYLLNNERLKEDIKAPLIQFKETDWEFLIRVLSRVGVAGFSLANGTVSLGFIGGEGRKRKDDGAYGKLGYVRERNQPLGYYIENENSYNLGEVIEIKMDNLDMKGNVTYGKIEYNSGKFVGSYILQQKEYRYPYISNKNIAGCVLEGRVEKVFQRDNIAVMEVDLTIGLSKYSAIKSRTFEELKEYQDNRNGRFIFPYTTPYSQSNTGYFCTPEINDIVAVYFPVDEEEFGYINWAVNNPGNARFSNPNVRNYTLKAGEERYFDFKLEYEKFNIFSKQLIDMETDEELNLKSQDRMSMRSKNEAVFSATENMSVLGKNMVMKGNKIKEIVLEEKQEIVENLIGRYLSKYKIDAKDMETVVQGNNFTQATKILKKS